MRKLLYLAALGVAATLILASVAAAQGVAPGGGSAAYGCPEDAPFPASAAGDPGEGSLRCFATQAEATEYAETGGTASPEPSSSPEASASPETTSVPPEESESLPETGGPGFVLPAAGLLVAGGLLGLRAVRRRS